MEKLKRQSERAIAKHKDTQLKKEAEAPEHNIILSEEK